MKPEVPLVADDAVARVLSETRSIALLGASPRPERPSYRVLHFLLDEGYDVFPVNPNHAGELIQGRAVYAALSEVPARIDLVDVFRQSRFLPGVVREAIDVGARFLWTQLGVVHREAGDDAERAGLKVVMDRCPAIEIPRLRAAGLLTR